MKSAEMKTHDVERILEMMEINREDEERKLECIAEKLKEDIEEARRVMFLDFWDQEDWDNKEELKMKYMEEWRSVRGVQREQTPRVKTNTNKRPNQGHK
jgi:hypothetical protein